MTDHSLLNDLKVVVVDDSDFSRNLIIRILKNAGVEVIGEANHAEVALAVIKDKKPNVVITDIVMPDISGIELTAQLSQMYKNLYIIIISSLSQEHVIIEAIGAGANDFLVKPVNEQQLIDSLEKIGTLLKEE